MNDFWNSELGQITGDAKEAFTPDFGVIPDNTKAIAMISKFCNIDAYDKKYLLVEWQIMDGDFKGRKVNQKLWVYEEDTKKRHRALNMFRLLYNMFQVRATEGAPTDIDLLPFANKQAGILIREWEAEKRDGSGEMMQGNWVSEVHPSTGFKSETGKSAPKPEMHKVEQRTLAQIDAAFETDVPF